MVIPYKNALQGADKGILLCKEIHQWVYWESANVVANGGLFQYLVPAAEKPWSPYAEVVLLRLEAQSREYCLMEWLGLLKHMWYTGVIQVCALRPILKPNDFCSVFILWQLYIVFTSNYMYVQCIGCHLVTSSHSFSLSFFLFVCVTVYLSVYPSVYLCMHLHNISSRRPIIRFSSCVFDILCLSLTLSMSLSLSLCVSLCLYVSLSVSLARSLRLSFSLSLSLSVYICLCLESLLRGM